MRRRAADRRGVAERDALVRQWTPLALKLAREFPAPAWVAREDIDQEALVALLQSARFWREDRGVRFNTYVWVAVRRRLIQFRARQCRGWRPRLADLPELPGAGRPDRNPLGDPADPRAADPAALAEARDLCRLALSRVRGPARRAAARLRMAGLGFLEIGRALGVSKERARQLFLFALDDCREALGRGV